MCAMGVSKIPSAIHLLGLDLSQQINSKLYIFFAHGFFFNRAGFIKRKILEMNVLFLYANIAAGGFGLTSPDQAFNGANNRGIYLVRFFLCNELSSCRQYLF